MPNTFRLLRNNKESGPFSLEELIQLSLRPFDLVWVEGKSAGWRYPSEIEVLKPYLEAQVPEEGRMVVEQVRADASEGRLVLMENSFQRPAIDGISICEHFEEKEKETEKVNEEEEQITAEKLEKKANEIYLRVQAYTKQKEQDDQNMQTRQARSLEDLKQEYADWLHHKVDKKKSGTGRKEVMIGLVVFFTGVGGYLVLDKMNSTDTPRPVQASYFMSNSANDAKADNKESNTNLKNSSAAIDKTKKKQLTVDEFIDSVEKALAEQDQHLARNRINYKKPVVKTLPQTLAVAPVEQHQAIVKKENLSNFVGLDAKYLREPNRNNISSLEITIRNNSSSFLKAVSVDVFYYRNNEKLFAKETLHFNNIEPGNSFTLSTPGNKKASSAKFQLGEVSE
jgi:hypothetical protein